MSVSNDVFSFYVDLIVVSSLHVVNTYIIRHVINQFNEMNNDNDVRLQHRAYDNMLQ